MAAGVTIKHKRKVGKFATNDLAAGEIGVDTTNKNIVYSSDGTNIIPASFDNFTYRFSTDITDSDPGTGYFKFDNTQAGNVAFLYISVRSYNYAEASDSDSLFYRWVWRSVDYKDVIEVSDVHTSAYTASFVFRVNGRPTEVDDTIDWVKIPVQLVSGSSSSTFSSGANCIFKVFSSSAGHSRQTTTITNLNLIPDNGYTLSGIESLKPTYSLLKVTTSHAAWVTLYDGYDAMYADRNRTIDTDPAPGSGVLAEVITEAGNLTQKITPVIVCTSDVDETKPLWVIDGSPTQDETDYNNTGDNGTFAGGTGHAVSDIITLSDGTKLTVDAVSSGVVTQFSINSWVNGTSTQKVANGDTLTQSATTGSGTNFTLTVQANNTRGFTYNVTFMRFQNLSGGNIAANTSIVILDALPMESFPVTEGLQQAKAINPEV